MNELDFLIFDIGDKPPNVNDCSDQTMMFPQMEWRGNSHSTFSCHASNQDRFPGVCLMD
jgi:hypothetical protein